MKHINRIGLLTLSVALGVTAVILLASDLAVAAAIQEVDLAIRLMAPTFVDTDATYVVNVSYANVGSDGAPDNWVRATLPPGTQFVESTYIGGAPRPPDVIDGNVLTWTVTPLWACSTWGHILVTLQTDETLPEGETLTFVADIATSASEPDTTNNTASVTTTVSYMGGSVKQVQARHAMPADVLDYSITINLSQQAGGGANRRWVTLTDTLPFSHQVRFLGWRGEVTGTLIDGHMLRWQGWVRAGEPLLLQYRLGVEGDVPPGTVLSNVAALGWHGRQMQLGPVNTVVTVPHGTIGLGPGQGGQVQHRYGITLDVPRGAVSDTTRFQLGPRPEDAPPIVPPGGLHFANRAFEAKAYRFGEPVGRFQAPLTITIRYSDTDVAGLRRETLRLWTRAGPGEPWAMMGEPVRSAPGTIAHTTTHLSEFALFGEPLDWGQVDLAIRGTAPLHVDVDSTYEVNVSYANLGWVPAPDSWVQVTLPAGTQFVHATYGDGEPRPPDEVDSNVLTWNLGPRVANSAWGHILITVATEEGLAEGETLEIEAEIGGSAPESNTDNNTVTMTSTVYDMGGAMKCVHARHAMPADVLEYTITVDLPQQGGGAQWVTVTDTLPARHQARFLGWSGEVSGTLIEGHRLRWEGEVRPGEPVQLRYRLGVEGDISPGTVLSNVAVIGWHGRQMQLGPVNAGVTVPHGVMGLGPGQGGEVQHRYGVALDVPRGAVSDTTRFDLGPRPEDAPPIVPPGGLQFANRAFEVKAYRFGEPVGQFQAPLTITAHYTDTDVAGLRRETLRLWTRSGPGEPWAMMGEPVRHMSGTIAHTTTHLSEFALFGEPEEQTWHHIYLPLAMR